MRIPRIWNHSFLLSVLVAIPAAAQVPGNFAEPIVANQRMQVKKDGIVTLESATGAKVEIHPTQIPKTVAGESSMRKGVFDMPAWPLPQADPARILFGKMNPERGWGLRLVRLEPKDGKAEVVLIMKNFDSKPAPVSAPDLGPYGLPEPTKQSDGTYALRLPIQLKPGIYAVVGFGGYSFVGKHYGVAWVFQVPVVTTDGALNH